eukprot:5246609-Lingulodinium_polyedra.AAC.1
MVSHGGSPETDAVIGALRACFPFGSLVSVADEPQGGVCTGWRVEGTDKSIAASVPGFVQGRRAEVD